MAEDEWLLVENWRFEQLVELGVSCGQAALLAANHAVDWHLIEVLIQRGCEPELATRIV